MFILIREYPNINKEYYLYCKLYFQKYNESDSAYEDERKRV